MKLDVVNPLHKGLTDDRSSSKGNQALRIAHIASPWVSVPPKDYGGTEAIISSLCEEQIKQGHQVTLFASGDSCTNGELKHYIDQSLSEQGISWSNYIEAEYHLVSSFREIANHPEKYDVVHTHLSSATDIILFKLASQIETPHLCTLHSRFPFDRRTNHVAESDRYYFNWAPDTPLIAISERAKEDALASSQLPLNFAGVIPHGLPNEQFLQDEVSQRDYLVWVGKIIEEKGTKYAVEAAVKAKRKLILAGLVDTCLPESVHYFYNEVLPLIKANPEFVEFIGPVNSVERTKLLKGAYCFLNPIQWEEPFGLVMIEAMACGCPVIAFKRGSAQELVQPGRNGELVASVEEMVAKIESIETTIDRKQLVIDTWNNYSATRMAERYVMKYREVIYARQKSLQSLHGSEKLSNLALSN